MSCLKGQVNRRLFRRIDMLFLARCYLFLQALSKIRVLLPATWGHAKRVPECPNAFVILAPRK